MRKLFFLLCLVLLVGCTQETKNVSYDETKKMMVDALQTEDGKKAIRQMMQEPQFKELLVLDDATVKTAIEQTLLSEKANEYWKEQFSDPKFQEAFAKSMKEQQMKLMKDLLKDSDYQQAMMDFFAQSEMQKQLEKVLKSAPLRKQTEEVVQETIENPLMQAKWAELIRKSGEGKQGGEQKKEEEQKKEDEKNKEEEQQTEEQQ